MAVALETSPRLAVEPEFLVALSTVLAVPAEDLVYLAILLLLWSVPTTAPVLPAFPNLVVLVTPPEPATLVLRFAYRGP